MLILTITLWCTLFFTLFWKQGCIYTEVDFRVSVSAEILFYDNKKHLKNVRPIRHNEPPHAHSADVASGTVARRLRIDVHDIDNDNVWQRGPGCNVDMTVFHAISM